jgi:ribosome-associated toxin RatA of RatAB toxin-antitoxin module
VQRICAPVQEVWGIVNDIESYSRFMDDVQSIEIVRQDGNERISTWSVLLKGSILEWTEIAHVDDAAQRISFRQLEGDLDHFTGFYQVDHVDDDTSETILEVEFEIGIPLLADMLNPVVCRALEENSRRMLRQIESRVGNSQT